MQSLTWSREEVGGRYLASLLAFFAFLGLLLFTIVEMRRGILFPLTDYLKIGAPSALLFLDLRQLPLLILGLLGTWGSYRALARLEVSLRERGAALRGLTRLLGLALLVLLIADLFLYRGVPASRILAAGKTGVGQALPLELLPGWLRPLGEGLDYMLLVWHATVLGILIGALFLTLAMSLVRSWLAGSGFRSHLAGTLLALGHPFCSCCAAPIGAALYRGGASLGPTLAFVVSSPMLNVTALILALTLLPLDFALLRILGGAVEAVLVTYLVSAVASRWIVPRAMGPTSSRLVEVSSRVLAAFNRLFQFETFLAGKPPDSPRALITTWLVVAWRLGRVVAAVLLVGAVVTSALLKVLPTPGNDLPGVLVAALLGTLLMVPTWTELPMALGLLREGLTGLAATLLITLPAVSLPCLLIIAGATGHYRAALLLGAAVFIAGIVAGVAFL